MSLPRTTNLWPPVDRTPATAHPTAPVAPVKTTAAMVFAIGSVYRSGRFNTAEAGCIRNRAIRAESWSCLRAMEIAPIYLRGLSNLLGVVVEIIEPDFSELG